MSYALPLFSGYQKGADTASVAFAPIRIKVFYEDLKDPSRYCTSERQSRPTFYDNSMATCSSTDILTSAKKDILVNYLMPSAIKLHAERLLVVPVHGLVELARDIISKTICILITIPPEHFTTGATDGDMFIYAAGGPMESDVAGWAVKCFFSPFDGRPLVGAVHINPHRTTRSHEHVRMITQEMAHVLGFTFNRFELAGIAGDQLSIRGKSHISYVTSPRTREKRQQHYDCPTAIGMELEDQGGSGTVLSHWKRRNAKDELMAGITGAGYYTALTMAVFEGLNFYCANFLVMSATSSWCVRVQYPHSVPREAKSLQLASTGASCRSSMATASHSTRTSRSLVGRHSIILVGPGARANVPSAVSFAHCYC